MRKLNSVSKVHHAYTNISVLKVHIIYWGTPCEGPKEDVVLHGWFMALRFSNFLAEFDPTAEQAAQVFLHVESLDSFANVVSWTHGAPVEERRCR